MMPDPASRQDQLTGESVADVGVCGDVLDHRSGPVGLRCLGPFELVHQHHLLGPQTGNPELELDKLLPHRCNRTTTEHEDNVPPGYDRNCQQSDDR